MVAEDDPLVGGLEIVAITQALSGSRAAVVESHDFGGDERAVEAIAHEIGADRGDDEPGAVDGLTAILRNGS